MGTFVLLLHGETVFALDGLAVLGEDTGIVI
jgi:hypothetical protein